jgi:predicted metal-dependent phosphoesterase TrpH
MMIDLHLHSTASDGLDAPEELVERAYAAGIRAISVTDHDTTASQSAVRAAAARHHMEVVPGIEITSVFNGKDVHVLAYGLPEDAPRLDSLLAEQRERRIARASEIGRKLAVLGVPIDMEALVRNAHDTKAVARPQIAACLVAAGHAFSIAEAFERYLGEGAPAYVAHRGASPTQVVELITSLGGVSSLAHPGTLKRDDIIPVLVEAGLSCLEAHHSAHSDETCAHYVALAKRFGLGITGGSDFHGCGTRRSECLGIVGLPPEEFERFKTLIANSRSSAAEAAPPRESAMDR